MTKSTGGAGSSRVQASEADRGARLDQFLAAHLPSLSRSRVQALIAAGQVSIDGRPARASQRIKGHESVLVEVPPPEPAEPAAEDLPLAVLYQDADLLVLDKAAGMVVHPAAGHRGGTLVNALLHHVKDLKGVGGALRPGLVHRLDKDTSGVLVIAKHDEALATLQAAFKAREVEKVYVALVHGQPADEGTFRTLHGRHPTQRRKFTGRVVRGKEAVTHWRVTRRFAHAARVEVRLETGRTHQIRVHFAEAGHPLVSDDLYGTRASRRPEVIGRQALHAWKLVFPHPRTGRRLCFTAPVPADFRAAEDVLAAEE
ncbi:MAG: RluA family pseudouridine synthase [Myxococcota bacterium]